MSLTKKDLIDLQALHDAATDFGNALFDNARALDVLGLLNEVGEFKILVFKKMEEIENDHWTFERDGEIFDAEFDTRDEAQIEAQDAFSAECEESGDYKSGQTAIVGIFLIRFKYGEDGKRVETERVPENLVWECFSDDRAEHGTWHSGGGGVL